METGSTKLGGEWYMWIHKGNARVILNIEEVRHILTQASVTLEMPK